MSTNTALELYGRFRRELSLLVATELKASDMGTLQMQIFIQLNDGPAAMGELSSATQSDKAAITRAIASLEVEGWVRRKSDSFDRRSSLVELTASGRKKAAHALKIRTRIGEALNSALGDKGAIDFCNSLETAILGLQGQRK